MRKEGVPEEALFFTPIRALFLFDLPPPLERLSEIISRFDFYTEGKTQSVSPEIAEEIKSLEEASFWRGIYPWLLLKSQGEETASVEGVLFYQLRQGEFWRLEQQSVSQTEAPPRERKADPDGWRQG